MQTDFGIIDFESSTLTNIIQKSTCVIACRYCKHVLKLWSLGRV